jgi:hypothetical protein
MALKDITRLKREKMKSQINVTLLERAIGKYYETKKVTHRIDKSG